MTASRWVNTCGLSGATQSVWTTGFNAVASARRSRFFGKILSVILGGKNTRLSWKWACYRNRTGHFFRRQSQTANCVCLRRAPPLWRRTCRNVQEMADLPFQLTDRRSTVGRRDKACSARAQVCTVHRSRHVVGWRSACGADERVSGLFEKKTMKHSRNQPS